MTEALVTIMMDIFYVMFGPPEHTNVLLQALFTGFFGFFEGMANVFSALRALFGG